MLEDQSSANCLKPCSLNTFGIRYKLKTCIGHAGSVTLKVVTELEKKKNDAVK